MQREPPRPEASQGATGARILRACSCLYIHALLPPTRPPGRNHRSKLQQLLGCGVGCDVSLGRWDAMPLPMACSVMSHEAVKGSSPLVHRRSQQQANPDPRDSETLWPERATGVRTLSACAAGLAPVSASAGAPPRVPPTHRARCVLRVSPGRYHGRQELGGDKMDVDRFVSPHSCQTFPSTLRMPSAKMCAPGPCRTHQEVPATVH